MKNQNMNYSNYEKDLKKELDLLDTLYKKLSKNKSDEKSLKKFEQLMKSKVDFKNLIPSSKSFESENLLTLSKLWMILILLKINKGKKQQQDFLTLVNSSLTRDLNEYEEYRQFYEDQCEQLFSDEEAITLINKNPRKEKKLEKPLSHEEARNNYIYLLYRPEYFKKIDVESFSKIKKVKDKSKSRSSNKTSSYIEDLTKEDETDENDEKGDRLNEEDMLSNVLTKIKALKEKEKNKDKNKFRTATNKKNKKVEEEKDDSEDKKIKKKKRGRKTEKKKIKSLTDDEDNSIDEDISSDNDYDKKNKHNKKDKNKKEKEKENDIKKYNKKKDKKKKDSKEEQTTEEEEEEKTKNKKLNKKEKSKEKDEDKRKSNKRNKAAESIYALLGIKQSESKSSEKEEKEEKSRKSKSVPPIKKEKQKQKDKKTKIKEDKKDTTKSNGRRGRQKKKKIEEEEEEEEDEYTSDSLSDLSGNNKYEDDLDKFGEDEKKLMEREIKAALEGRGDELGMDFDNFLEGSKAEGLSLDHFNSNESDMDLDEY